MHPPQNLHWGFFIAMDHNLQRHLAGPLFIALLLISAAVLIDVFSLSRGNPVWLAGVASASSPPYTSSVVGTDFDYITDSDPSAFQRLDYVGFLTDVEMPSKPSGSEPLRQDAYVFDAFFTDGTRIRIYEDKDFGSYDAARADAMRYTPRLGKLPSLYRQKLKHIVVQKGGPDTTAFAEDKGHFFVIYSDNATKRISTHDLEETFFHEGSHASIQADYIGGSAWNNARAADNKYITNYAATDIQEDFAESALFAYTIIHHPERFPAADRAKIEAQIPNRIEFFRTVFTGSTGTDVCPNISGVQTSVPSGYIKDGAGNCVPQTETDVCPNITGVQTSVPSGYIKDGAGNCVPQTETDVCPNITGVQTSVPSGYIKDGSGNCVLAPTDFPPPTGSPVPGADPSPQTVTLSAPGSTSIRYTTNGTTPTCSTGTLYSTPFPVHVTTAIKAIACYSSGSSPVATLSYVIGTDVCPNMSGMQTTVPSGYIKDSAGNCVQQTQTDVCPNITGVQTSVPSGYIKDGSGNCVPQTETDVCPNISGVQTSVPSGYIKDSAGNCVPQADVCPNIAGVQTFIPSGYMEDEDGNCVPEPEPESEIDVCPNISGVQSSLPSGYMEDEDGNCVPEETETDVCPNISGVQAFVPSGYVKNSAGSCVTVSVDMCPNIAGTQGSVPIGYVKNSAGSCVPASVDMCPNISGAQTTVPSGYVKNSAGSCVSESDICPNISGTQTSVPRGYVKSSTGNCLSSGSSSPNIDENDSSGTAPSLVFPSASDASKLTLSRTLSRGIQGEDVRSLQRYLMSTGHLSSGNDTGFFGPITELAVKRFQCALGVICSGSAADGYGVVGPKTRAALNASVRQSIVEKIKVLQELLQKLQNR